MMNKTYNTGFALALMATLVIPSCKKKENSAKQTAIKQADIQQDPKVEEVLTKILDAWKQTTNFRAFLKTELTTAGGGPGRTKGEGTYDYSVKDSNTRIKFSLSNVLARPLKDEPNKSLAILQTHLYVTDGITLHTLIKTHTHTEMKESKYNPSDILQLGGETLLNELRTKNRLQFLSETSINSRSVYLIEATPHEGNWKTLYYFEQKTGLLLQLIERDSDGKESYKLEIIDFDTSIEFPDDHFHYTDPESS